MAGKFEGRVALVTGGGSGIGRASALAFAREGARVAVSDVDREGGEETVRQIRQRGAVSFFAPADVTRAEEVEALIQRTLEEYSRLDCAHNNAGTEGIASPTAECTEENWDRILATNLKGAWLCLKYEIPVMLRQGGGAIVNTASVSGLIGVRNLPAYVASKHGVVGLTKTAALEYARAGIRINAVCPGFIRTPMLERLTGGDPQTEAQWTSLYPVGRLGGVDEVAEAVVWLCSDAASFVVGHALVVDGGRTVE